MEPASFYLHTARAYLRRVLAPAARLHRGFTLVEMTVVLAIIGVITAVTLSSQSSFNKTIVLANTAYDIGLTMRNAQTYGIGSKNVSSNFGTGYGLSFGNPPLTTFTLFADIYPASTAAPAQLCHPPKPTDPSNAPDAHPGNCVYEAASDSKQQTYTLGNNMKVSAYCAKAGGLWQCTSCSFTGAPSPCTSGLSKLDIVFTRPNTSATITTGTWPPTVAYTDACIVVSSVQTTSRFVTVSQIGQVTVNTKTSCNY